MKRITPEVKAIADAHLKAIADGNFDDPIVRTKEELIDALKQGKTFSKLVDQFEARYISIGSSIISRLGVQSDNYKKGIYKGFKHLFA